MGKLLSHKRKRSAIQLRSLLLSSPSLMVMLREAVLYRRKISKNIDIRRIAATSSPIIFIGTGEQIPDLESFEPQAFVSRLLGMGDIPGLVNLVNEAIPKEKQKQLETRLAEGKFSLRDMQDHLTNVMSMGPLDKVMGMMPGFEGMPQLQGTAKLKNFVHIMDSMTELGCCCC